MKLTSAERLIIAQQLRMLEILEPESAEFHARDRKAVEQGFESEYEPSDGLFWSIYENVLSVEECQEVLDIMQMFADMKAVIEMHGISTVKGGTPKFFGFAANFHEIRQVSYARYLVDGGKFDGMGWTDCDSHSPATLPTYRSWLRQWSECKGDNVLPDKDSAERFFSAVNE